MLALISLAGPYRAMAATPVLTASCSFSVQNILFGAYDPSAPVPLNTIAQFSVNCNGPSSLTLSIGASHTGGSGASRQMRHLLRSETLAYNLFQDSSYTRAWGDGAIGSALVVSVAGRYTGQIFGQIFAGQDSWVGDYEDTVTITVLP